MVSEWRDKHFGLWTNIFQGILMVLLFWEQNKTKSNNISNSILASSSSENFSHILQYFVCRILIVKFLKVHGIRLISSCSNWICSQVNIEWPKRLNLHYSLEKRENFENFVVMCMKFMSNQFGINFNLMQNLFEPLLLAPWTYEKNWICSRLQYELYKLFAVFLLLDCKKSTHFFHWRLTVVSLGVDRSKFITMVSNGH